MTDTDIRSFFVFAIQQNMVQYSQWIDPSDRIFTFLGQNGGLFLDLESMIRVSNIR